MSKKKFDDDEALCCLAKRDAVKDFPEDYLKLVLSPRYVCKKCGRVAHNKKNLCEPKNIQKILDHKEDENIIELPGQI